MNKAIFGIISVVFSAVLICCSTDAEDREKPRFSDEQNFEAVIELSAKLQGKLSKESYSARWRKLIDYTDSLNTSELETLYAKIKSGIINIPMVSFPLQPSQRESIAWRSIEAILLSTNSKELIIQIISTTPPRQVGFDSLSVYLKAKGFRKAELEQMVANCKNPAANQFIESEIREFVYP